MSIIGINEKQKKAYTNAVLRRSSINTKKSKKPNGTTEDCMEAAWYPCHDNKRIKEGTHMSPY